MMSKGNVRQRVKAKPRGAITDDNDDPNWPYAKGNMDPLAKIVGISIFVVTVSLIGYFRYQQYLKDIIISPLSSPKIISDNSSSPSVSPERFWGTYRPHAYFGMKTRSSTSPVFGLMWLSQMTGQMPPPLRHWCDQGDKLDSYMWQMHDGINFGIQEIRERDFTVKTEFVKRSGGDHGGEWSARLSFTPKNAAKAGIISAFFYVALDGDEGKLEPALNKGKLKAVNGFHKDLDNFQLLFSSAQNNNQKESYLITHAKRLDQLKEVLQSGLKVEAWDKARTIPYFTSAGRRVPRDVPGPNFIVKEVSAYLPFSMEVAFQSGSFMNRPDQLLGDIFTRALETRVKEFNSKFETVFKLKEKGYNEDEIQFAKAAMSNMVGGIGYFHGSSIVQSKYNKEPVLYWEAPLYTAVPSRPFFPRGFLWDEGFHNLLISMWDPEISKDIIGHWLDLLNVEGWIPREQILGLEARAKVPAEFVIQRNTNANPPTLFLPIQNLIKDMIKNKTPKDIAYLEALFPRLKTWFDYYNTSQTGIGATSYYWHGRDPTNEKQLNPLTLASGLDDYPRASHPTENERHVDLRCWIALASGVMADIAKTLGRDARFYEATHEILKDNTKLDELHWSTTGKQYSDFGLHTDKARLEKPKPPVNLQPGQRPPPQMNLDKVRVVLKPPALQFVNALGYVSLFPFITKIIDADSPKLNQIFDDITNPSKLWTNYGLRSLSRNSKFYGRFNTEHDPPYWRGQIWINMNYLTLSALHHYSSLPGPYRERAKEVYESLRKNIITNVVKEYYRTGFIWENYNDNTGNGQGAHPFTGWSSLVVLMMAEKY